MDHFGEEEYSQKDFDLKIMRRLLNYVAPFKWQVVLSIFLLLFVSALELMGPILTKHAIDVDIACKDMVGLRRTVFLYFIILVFILAAHFIQMYLTSWVGQKAVLNLRMEVFSHLQKLSPAYFDRNPVGRLMTRVTSDVQSLDETISAGIVSIFGDIFILVGIVSVMLWMNWKLAIITFIMIPIVFYLSLIFRKFAREAFREIRLRLAKINSFLNENITGISVTHLFNLHNRNRGNFDILNKDYYDSNIRAILYFAIFFPSIELISSISVALILGYGGGLILGGMLTLGGLLAFLQYTERFFHPIRDLSEKYNILQSAMASSERIFTLLDTTPEVQPPAKPVSIGKMEGRIEFRNVFFSYKEGVPVLKAVSFTVEPGKTVAIVGHTGAGKSTLINLLCRFYDVDSGAILLDSVDIKEIDPIELRRRIGLVQQDLFLFSGTIEQNICIDPERSDCEKAKSFASTVRADKFIVNRLSGGYDTVLGERGATLSIGQRQLLSFARALSVEPQILLLDEATSSVDPETEGLIQDGLKVLLKGRTSIVVAHRLSTIREADNIIVLHKGVVRESGTHDELLKMNGIYSKLHKIQTGVFANNMH